MTENLSLLNKIVFDDLEPQSVEVQLGKKLYRLKEASGDASCKWRNAMMRATKLGPNGRPVSVDGMADVEPLLLSLCLFEVTDKGERSVRVEEIRSWPNKVQKSLYDRLKLISGLETEEPETEETLTEKIKELLDRRDELRVSKSSKDGEDRDPLGSPDERDPLKNA